MYDEFYKVFLPQPEVWKDVVGYEDLYTVSNHGRIKNKIKGNILAHKYDKYGVDNVALSNKGHTKSFSVCKLMVASFYTECSYLEHFDGILKNNVLWNIKVINQYKPSFNNLELFNEDTLTKELLRDIFDYHEDGYLLWKKRPPEHFADLKKYRVFNTMNCGKIAGYYNKRTDSKRDDFGYWRVGITLGTKLKHFKLHRLIFKWHYGYLPDVVDHKDANQRNNKIDNLREGNVQKNSCNLRKNINNTSGYKGVTKSTNPKRKHKLFIANIVSEGKRYYLGSYETAEDAAYAYDCAAKVLHKDFCYTNNVKKTSNFSFNAKFFLGLYQELLEKFNQQKHSEEY